MNTQFLTRGATPAIIPDRPTILENLSGLREEWEQAVDGASLIHVSASVGLLLFNITARLGLTQVEQAQVLGDQLFKDALIKSQL
jgi:hypothetical protein